MSPSHDGDDPVADIPSVFQRIAKMREDLSMATPPPLHPRLVWLALKAAGRLLDAFEKYDRYPQEEAARISFDADLRLVRFALRKLGSVAPVEDMPIEMYEGLREEKKCDT